MKLTALYRNKRFIPLFLISIPLGLSAFTHLWNPTGFPSIYVDEDHYMRRAMKVLKGEGFQESASTLNEHHPYDHPYLGQLFLAAAFSITGYPDSLNPKPGEGHMIETLYLVPRVLMGFLAILDTFFIYKICERRYDRNIAFVAAILFAVMPLGWPLRRILLESIQLPFLLSSVLFALYSCDRKNRGFNSRFNVTTVLLSGTCLGLAIFTKIPAISFIPAVALLIYINNNNKQERAKFLGMWFVPVILIPVSWPAYSMLVGEFNQFLEDLNWQSTRIYRSLYASIQTLFEIDPVLLTLAIFGIIYVTVKKRDFFPLTWSIPLPIFLETLGYVQFYMLIPLMPIFCMSGAILINAVSKRITIRTNGFDKTTTDMDIEHDHFEQTNKTYFIIAALIGIFGLISTTILITTNLNSTYFAIYSSIVRYLYQNPDNSNDNGEDINNNDIALIGGRSWIIHYSWIPRYVFDTDLKVFSYQDLKKSVPTKKMLLILDNRLSKVLDKNDTNKRVEQLKNLYNKTNINSTFSHNIAYDTNMYPYTSLRHDERLGNVQLRINDQN